MNKQESSVLGRLEVGSQGCNFLKSILDSWDLHAKAVFFFRSPDWIYSNWQSSVKLTSFGPDLWW